MKHIEIVAKNDNTEVWLNFRSKNGAAASICLNNLANDRPDAITRIAMQKSIAEYLTANTEVNEEL